MVSALIFKIKSTLANKSNKRWLLSLLIITGLIFVALKPQQFADLWLTRDQQGQLLFNRGQYELASKTFTNTRWQAFSAYGNEDYSTAASLYSQFDDVKDLLARANALAHERNYVKARSLYQYIIQMFPEFKAAQTNLAIVQAIIEENELLSQSQQAESGESSKKLGDEPQSSEGAEQRSEELVEIEQLSSDQLLLDDNLNKMWLRQVQKNPSHFLSQKFYMQLDNKNQQENSEDDNSPEVDTND